MIDSNYRASEIAKWRDLGVDLPKPLTDALETRSAVLAHEKGLGALPTLAAVKKNPEAAIADYAAALAAADKQNQAVAGIDRVVSDAVVAAANDAVPGIIEQLRPRFDAAAERYAEAVGLLPQVVTAEAVATGSTSIVRAYQEAKESAETMTGIQDWLKSTVVGRVERPVLLIVEPDSADDVSAIVEAARNATDSFARSVRPDLRKAVELGASFRMARPTEANGLYAALTKPEPAPAKPNRIARAWEANYQ